MAKRAGADPENPLAALSKQELHVLSLLASGLTNAAIAGELQLSERTIESHVRKVFSALALPRDTIVHRRVAAASLYLRWANQPLWKASSPFRTRQTAGGD
jgi:DNA-binding NarL/FixJ family response regulator